MNNLRIAFGLSQTIIDVEEFGNDFSVKLRPGVRDLLEILKHQGHTLILWTSKKRMSFGFIKRQQKELFELFDEVYCKEDFELIENIPGCSLHIFKNINKIKADCLIETKEAYKKYSNILQMGEKYCIISKYREFLLNDPTPWMIKVLGKDVVEKREKRRQEKENWVIDVFDYIENLKKQIDKTAQNNLILVP